MFEALPSEASTVASTFTQAEVLPSEASTYMHPGSVQWSALSCQPLIEPERKIAVVFRESVSLNNLGEEWPGRNKRGGELNV